MAITDDEERVIEILVSHPPTSNLDGEPIFAVGAAMKWDTLKTKSVVADLEKRGLLHRTLPKFKDHPPGTEITMLKLTWRRVEEQPLFT